MNQFIYLSTCNTCKSILEEVNLPKDITLRDIKKNPLKPNELKSFKNITGTFRSLLNNRAQKLKNIDKSILSEEKIFSLLNEHYTYIVANEDAEWCRRIGEHGLPLLKQLSKHKGQESEAKKTHKEKNT